MKNFLRQIVSFNIISLVISLFVGCSSKENTPHPDRQITVYLKAIQPGSDPSSSPTTRTAIGGENLDHTYWSERDTIELYWRTTGSSDALNNGQPFSCYRFEGTVSTFSTEMEALPSGSYDYFATYPKPASVNGTQVTYNLPAEQPGIYCPPDLHAEYTGNLDFMLATPLSSQPNLDGNNTLTMNFIHQCHVMRIQVPTGRNQWGSPIHKLRVEFPSPVVGRMTMDLTDPTATPTLTEGSNTVTAVLSKPLTESEEDDVNGNYVWLFLCPGTVNGTVRFTAYNENGYQSQSLSIELNKTLEAGKITPVNMTIPQELPVSWIDFSIVGNNLGEEPQSFTVTAPSGATFRNGTATQTFAINSENKYSLAFYNEVDGVAVGDLLSQEGVTITYDTPNVLISEQTAVTVQPEGHTTTHLTVPYLLYEDFSDINSFDYETDRSTSNPDAIWLDQYGLTGWSGTRVGVETGKAMRISVRHETVAQYPGRVDSPPLSAIKEGHSVKVRFSFNAGQTSEWVRCKVGVTTENSLHSGNTEPEGGSTETQFALNADYNNIPNEYTFQSESFLQSCTNQTRLSWNVVREYGLGNAFQMQTWFIYLDNIRVSIIQ